jgi:hypothetical protein
MQAKLLTDKQVWRNKKYVTIKALTCVEVVETERLDDLVLVNDRCFGRFFIKKSELEFIN